jgi:hypothetical protein
VTDHGEIGRDLNVKEAAIKSESGGKKIIEK